jgi:hypothetical protein
MSDEERQEDDAKPKLPSWQRKAMRDVPEHETVICKHQERGIAAAFRDAEMLGRDLQITSKDHRELDLVTVAAFDLTPAEHAEWARRFIAYLFESGEVDMTCEQCGAVAMWPLVPEQLTPRA